MPRPYRGGQAVTGVEASERRKNARLAGPLGQPPDQVAVPVLAVGQVDAHLGAVVRPGAAARPGRMPYSIWYSKLAGLRPASDACARGDGDQPRVVGGHHRVAAAVHAAAAGSARRTGPPRPGSEGHLVRGLVGALAQPDPGPGRGQRRAVRLGCAAGRTGSRSPGRGTPAAARPGSAGSASTRVWSSMSSVTVVPAARGRGADPGDVLRPRSSRRARAARGRPRWA